MSKSLFKPFSRKIGIQCMEPELFPDRDIYIFFKNRDSNYSNKKVKQATSI